MTLTDSKDGVVVGLWRYPVKSMMGEELNAATFASGRLVGDRAYAIVDPETGKVASAKNPKKWPSLFDCHAAYVQTPGAGAIPPVRVTLPDGQVAFSGDSGFDATLSATLGRAGTLQTAVPDRPVLEEYWPDMEELDHQDEVTDEDMPLGTFFDIGPVHLLTTGTLDGLRAAYPAGRFETRRFRPNIVVRTDPQDGTFPESAWLGRTVALGDEVRLKVTGHCGRCVMTTLAQGDLPRDPGILRAAAHSNGAHVGVYAEVVEGGTTRRGDVLTLL